MDATVEVCRAEDRGATLESLRRRHRRGGEDGRGRRHVLTLPSCHPVSSRAFRGWRRGICCSSRFKRSAGVFSPASLLLNAFRRRQERQEPGEKFVEAGKSLLIEIAELEEHRAELFAEEVRGGEEGFEFGVAIVQDLFVGDLLRDFQGEDEVFGRL